MNDAKPDILSCLAHLSSDEVFTPPSVANKMLDLLPDEIWSNKNIRFLNPVSKSGVFLREITKRLLDGLKFEMPHLNTRLYHILQNQVFGLGITELTTLLSRRTVYCSKKANGEYSLVNFENEEGNIRYINSEHNWVRKKCTLCGASQDKYKRKSGLENHAYSFIHHSQHSDKLFDMKFDVIIGNPPYQLNDGGGTGSSAIPIYQKFVEQAIALKPKFISFIIPSRWFTSGKGLDDFRKKMLSDTRFRVLHDYIDARDCFTDVEIKGGGKLFSLG